MIYVEVKNTPKMGRGVFATKNFSIKEIIEVCSVYVLTPKEVKTIASTNLENWFFSWKKKLDAMLFGYGMIYNHSQTPNAIYKYDYRHKKIIFMSNNKIKKGEQIFIDYNQHNDHTDDIIPMFHPKTKKYLDYKIT